MARIGERSYSEESVYNAFLEVYKDFNVSNFKIDGLNNYTFEWGGRFYRGGSSPLVEKHSFADAFRKIQNVLGVIEKAKDKYNNRFTYDISEAFNTTDNLIITDSLSGIVFKQSCYNHLRGVPKKIENSYIRFKKSEIDLDLEHTSASENLGKFKEEFLEYIQNKSNIRWGNQYRVISAESKREIVAECKDHGEFKTRYSRFINTGCPSCNNKRPELKAESSIIEYMNFLYDGKYSLVSISGVPNNYKIRDTLTMRCPGHGEISKSIELWIMGGCHDCAKKERGQRQLLSESEFINNAKIRNPYIDFSISEYKNWKTPVELICPVHGKQKNMPQNIYGARACPECNNISLGERIIADYLKELGVTFEFHKRIEYNNKIYEADIFVPEHNLAIEYNGIAWHHSSKNFKHEFINKMYREPLYHFKKFKAFNENNIPLIGIPDFYWEDQNKQKIIKSKISHYLKMDKKVFARKCHIEEIDNKVANSFYDETHIDGSGFPYEKQRSFALKFEDEILMSVSIGYLYNQSSKKKELKVSRISTKLNTTVVGGLSKLLKYLKNNFGSFKYQFTLMFGASTTNAFEYKILKPRYYWVNYINLKYYHRNECQKRVLEKNFGEPLLDNDTEASYMQRLNCLRFYDYGLGEIIF